jgi:endogenous inhibitor of DNA gyrase (YacG/DUF329 family)
MDPSSSLVVRCPQCGQHGTWFAARWGPFCSERCRLVDLGRWFNEEHRLSRPLNAADFSGMDEMPGDIDPDRPNSAT